VAAGRLFQLGFDPVAIAARRNERDTFSGKIFGNYFAGITADAVDYEWVFAGHGFSPFNRDFL
jgi:hypothetical protein